MKGNITPELKSNMKSNMPSNLHSDNVEKLVANFKSYWNQKLSKPVSKSIDPKVKEGIVKAATESGEDPNTWLKMAEIESAGGKNTHRPGSKYHGIFQIDASYVNDKKDLYDPYKSTLAAISLSKNKWGKNSKLEYEEGGMIDSKYQEWRNKLPKNLQYDGDYDLRGLYESNPNVTPSSNMHFPDTFKLPNHPTFSNESKYYDSVTPGVGGYWGEGDENFIKNPLIGAPVPHMRQGGMLPPMYRNVYDSLKKGGYVIKKGDTLSGISKQYYVVEFS